MLVCQKGTNRVFHLLLSIVTGGLWVIVWLLCAIKIGGDVRNAAVPPEVVLPLPWGAPLSRTPGFP